MNSDKMTEQKLKLLLQLEVEIKKIEKIIKNQKNANLKINVLKMIKIFLRLTQWVLPYFLTAGVIFGGFAHFGSIPFHRELEAHYLQIQKEFDSLGNIRYEQEYRKEAEIHGIVTYYGKWEKDDYGFYSRKVDTYKVKNGMSATIKNLVMNKDIKTISDVLGEIQSSKKETRNNLTEEEINSDAYMKAIVHNEVLDDFIMVEESVDEDSKLTALYILITVIMQFFVSTLRKDITKFDLKTHIKTIKETHKEVDIEDLTQKLELKIENYERLIGKKYERK